MLVSCGSPWTATGSVVAGLLIAEGPEDAVSSSRSSPAPRTRLLPGELHRKLPSAGREWPWQWVFPATRTYLHGPTCQRRRHYFHVVFTLPESLALLVRKRVEVFVRRLLAHVLPRGFVRIRYHGFLANRVRKKRVALCRELLGHASRTEEPVPAGKAAAEDDSVGDPRRACPECKVS
jgi:hypothetical protein